jgi:hypothetical protein
VYIPKKRAETLVEELTELGDTVVGPEILSYLEDAERNPPTLRSHDAFAGRADVLRTSEGWRRLSDIGAKEGCVADGYDGEYGRIGPFAK